MKILTAKEMAAYLRVSTLYLLRREREGMPVIRAYKGADKRFNTTQVLNWIEKTFNQKGDRATTR